LALLVFFKYTGMLVSTVKAITDFPLSVPDIMLPIGISFFTFTQIAYLVDTYQSKVSEYRFWDYALFVSYFPHQIAGPILHHQEMMRQFTKQLVTRINVQFLLVGLSIFTLGLAKKVLIADTLATFSDPVFLNAEMQISPSFIEAWGAAMAYTLQLYFDFSAYCDMAIGISLMFGIKLPLNFNSPYQSVSMIDFWRRWHMTLSRFLRDYLYIPLGGNRLGQMRRYINLLITMTLGGLWHGASWTFLCWGLLHGVYLAINHAWQTHVSNQHGWSMPNCLAWAITMLAVIIAWVLFKATTFSAALVMLTVMFVPHQILVPEAISSWLPLSNQAFFVASSNWSGAVGGITALGFIALIWLATIRFPNVQQMFKHQHPFLDADPDWARPDTCLWQPTWIWLLVLSTLLAVSMLRLGNDSTFLYFNF
jgi:D-alanyl-lipoteichoic acid acyltransferase DltB (MBOAT superfamily)